MGCFLQLPLCSRTVTRFLGRMRGNERFLLRAPYTVGTGFVGGRRGKEGRGGGDRKRSTENQEYRVRQQGPRCGSEALPILARSVSPWHLT